MLGGWCSPAVHSCVVRARLEDGLLLRWIVGSGLGVSEQGEKRCIAVPEGVDWEALELWIEEMYTGSSVAFEVFHGRFVMFSPVVSACTRPDDTKHTTIWLCNMPIGSLWELPSCEELCMDA